MSPIQIIAALVFIFIVWLIFGKIFSKAGYSKWLGLLMFVPLANLCVLIWFCIARWPVQKEVDRLTELERARVGTHTPGTGP